SNCSRKEQAPSSGRNRPLPISGSGRPHSMPRRPMLLRAQKQIAVLRTQRAVAQGQLEQAKAAHDLAEANLARTAIKAPTAGRIAKLTAAKGDYAQIGQSLMMFVRLRFGSPPRRRSLPTCGRDNPLKFTSMRIPAARSAA